MNQPEHPSVEQISDLLAGALPASEAMDANAHLASCEACRDVRRALLDVSTLLADEGAASWVMPPDVATSIDAAIARASAERVAGVRSIDASRSSTGGSPPDSSATGGRQPWKWLMGAAAAVVVVGVGFAGLRALPQQSNDSADSAGQLQASQPSASFDSGVVGGAESTAGESYSPSDKSPPRIPDLSARPAVIAAGRSLARDPADAVSTQEGGCAEPLTGGPTTVVRFEGHPAVLTISRDTRLVTIYDCATATKTLFVTEY